jgi:hypothetical protein
LSGPRYAARGLAPEYSIPIFLSFENQKEPGNPPLLLSSPYVGADFPRQSSAAYNHSVAQFQAIQLVLRFPCFTENE